MEYVFGLDIGTRNVVGTVGYMSDGEFHVACEVTKQHKTRAMLDGQIHNIARVSEVVCEVKEELEAKINQPLTKVCIAAAGRVLVTETTTVKYEYPEESVVVDEDLHTLDLMGIDQAKRQLDEKQNEKYKFYCVGYSVVKYYLNGDPFGSLEGHKANEISEDIIVTFLPEDVVDGLYTAVGRAGLEVANLTLEPIAAMNVAIPENFRMLNIALVDVGAGTSDLCITKDGSIAAYGMIPYAGDELTEVIVQAYLVDFATAEQIKLDSTFKDEVTYTDIMGISHTIDSEEVWKLLSETREKITTAVAEKIIELNGDKPVAATFVVGGGGKVHGFCTSLAKKLGIMEERVALRGEEAMNEVTFDEAGIVKDPLLVTPIGICLNYFEQRNSFIMVHFNGEMLKIYDNGKLTIVDAALQAGLDTQELFPKRGAELNITVNGISRMIRGIEGESAEVRMNGEVVGLNTPLKRDSDIEFIPSTTGQAASAKVSDLSEYTTDNLYFVVNQKRVACPKFVEVNGILESPDYELKDGDKVDTRNYYTVGQLAKFMDIQLDPQGDISVNNKQASLDTLVYENFSVDWDTLDFASMDDSYISEENLKEESVEDSTVSEDSEGELDSDSSFDSIEESETTESGDSSDVTFKSINVKINGNSYTLTGKKDYIFVDIFTVYPFDTNQSNGRAVYTMINSNPCGYIDSLSEGDSVEIGWKEK
ncbi:MAG: rod shape-determining protein [Lachnospiraceae bacterium]|nr:rod shape-determining protein [Lachnospiraceae bacterium]